MARIITTKQNVLPLPSTDDLAWFPDANGNPCAIDTNGVKSILGGKARYNWLRNSLFWFAQRQAPATLTTYSSLTGRAFTADGWAVTNENASAQYQRTDALTTPEAGLSAPFYGNFTKITAGGKLAISQCIEGKDIAQLRGRTVRLQFKAKGIIAASTTWRVGLIQLNNAGTVDTIPAAFISAFNGGAADPTLGANLAYIAPKATVTPYSGTIVGNANSISVLASVWAQHGVCFDVPSNCKNLIVMIWSDQQIAATNGIAISEVALIDGFEMQDLSPTSQSEELRRVQRFYQKTFEVDTAPVTNAGVATGALRCILGKAAAVALAAQFQWRYGVPLRAAATTLTTYNPGAANAQVRQISGTAADLTATATANSTAASVDITATGAATGAIGDQCGVHVTADAEL